MPQYTTGELAKLCGASVRAVQFYDGKDLLKPSALTEGGRRLYSDADLKRLQLICLLKSIGLSLGSVKGILGSESPEKVLLLLLDEQAKQLEDDIAARQEQLKKIHAIKTGIGGAAALPINAISGIGHMMDSKKKLKRFIWQCSALVLSWTPFKSARWHCGSQRASGGPSRWEWRL